MGYGVAVASVLAALSLTLAFRELLSATVFILFFAAVTLSAWFGGRRPVLLAIVLSTAAGNYFVLGHPFAWNMAWPDVVRVVLFAGIALLISAMRDALDNARLSEAQHARDAEEYTVQLQEQATELEATALELEQQTEEAQALAGELEAANEQLQVALAQAEAARAAAERAAFRASFLARASSLLASSLDYEETLRSLTRLAVPELADWCSVQILADGELRQLAVAHVDPEKVRFARELRERFPIDLSAPRGVPHVLRTGESELYPEIPDELLVASSRCEEELCILRELGLSSAITVPLTSRGEVLGALSLVAAESGDHYDADDLQLAEELGRRAGVAIDHARAFRQARAASEAKSAFMATMSHELRTPLNAVIGYADLLALGIPDPLPDSALRAVERITVSARHLLEVIDAILTHVRIEAGREEVSVETVDVGRILDEAAVVAEPLAAAKGLSFRVEPSPEPLLVETDPRKLRQILVNLLGNAVKFTDRGEAVVRTEADGDALLIQVCDTGIGILPEHLERIFEPFWQAETAKHLRVSGTGLGLAVSRNLARLLGGDLTVESTPGEGSTFTLRLPYRLPPTGRRAGGGS
ncbi:MAG TPA: ATP-binding protein [Longimicrobiaceae bacterium]|nr:ATP-binding protein [Longimicrobiaceae bacterium]